MKLVFSQITVCLCVFDEMQQYHLPVFSSSVLGVLGLLIITTKWLSTRGIYFDVSGPETLVHISYGILNKRVLRQTQRNKSETIIDFFSP